MKTKTRKGWLWAAMLCAAAVGACPAAAVELASTSNAASTALRSGHADQAVRLYSEALQSPDLAPIDRARALLNRGLAYQQLGQREQAVADFTNAIWLKILPPEDLARALFDRGVTLDEMGKTEFALTDYSAALGIAPDFAAALNNRANAYRRLGHLDEAKRDYEASLAKGNEAPEYPLYGLGQVAEARGNKTAALAYYRRALDANGGYSLAAERIAALGGDAHALSLAAFFAPPAVPAPTSTPASLDGGARQDLPTLRPRILDSVAPPPATGGATSGRMQLGAYRDETTAALGWNHLVAQAQDLLHGLKPDIVRADIAGKGTYYRLRLGPLPRGRDAKALCRELQARGFACMMVSGGEG